jgi:hypothetical protein
MLKTVAVAGAAPALPIRLLSQIAGQAPSADAILCYLESLARPDGGYAWEDQEDSHLTPTLAVIGCYHVLGQMPPNRTRVAEFVRTHHPAELKKLEQERRIFEFQQVQALAWLGENTSAFRDKIRGWTRPLTYLKQYERHGYPIFQSELGAIRCRELIGLPLDDLSPHFTNYLETRRRANGSFNNTAASDGGDGHVLNTWWGLQALRVLGRAEESKDQTIAWLRACQLPIGGFTYQPKPEFGGVDDVAYTWAAVRALKLLGASLSDRDSCLAYVHSLANADGGFSDRPGWLSNPLATCYALDTLHALDALDSLTSIQRRAPRWSPALPHNLNAFSIQIEAHGQGSPADAVELARALRIHLWGAKNARPGWIARAQAIADQQGVPVRFFVANEEYGTWVNVPGLGTYSHTSDIIAPAGAAIGQSLATQGVVSWPEFRERRLVTLTNAASRLVWQFGENEELVRMFLDDSVERGGYAAISTFHFGNPDFLRTEPFLQRWRGQIPYVALQDAHGNEPWWIADVTTAFRTVFLATEPTWEGWLNALKQNWVVAVRHDTWTGFKTWMHSGSREVLDAVRVREGDWRWWDNPDILRPMVSIVPIRAGDEFEVARPDEGVTLRIRCAWQCTPHGLLKEPIAELVKLTVDGVKVSPTLATAKAPRSALLSDHYHHFHLANPKPSKHQATVVVRVLATKGEAARTVQFIG